MPSLTSFVVSESETADFDSPKTSEVWLTPDFLGMSIYLYFRIFRGVISQLDSRVLPNPLTPRLLVASWYFISSVRSLNLSAVSFKIEQKQVLPPPVQEGGSVDDRLNSQPNKESMRSSSTKRKNSLSRKSVISWASQNRRSTVTSPNPSRLGAVLVVFYPKSRPDVAKKNRTKKIPRSFPRGFTLLLIPTQLN